MIASVGAANLAGERRIVNMGARLAVVADDDDSGLMCLVGLLKGRLGYDGVMATNSFARLFEILQQQPGIRLVVLATHIRGFGGTRSIKKIRKACPAARLVVFGDVVNRESILALLADGIHGFLSRRLPPEDMAAALRFIDDGHIAVPSDFADDHRMRSSAEEGCKVPPPRTLTRRQAEILELLSQGLSNKVIARRLHISPSTVKGHVEATYRILGVHDRRTAAASRQ